MTVSAPNAASPSGSDGSVEAVEPAKPKPVIGYRTSGRSRVGMKVAARLLGQHARLKALPEPESEESIDLSNYDLIFSHVTLNIEHHLRPKTVVFALRSTIDALRDRPELLEDYRKNPPLFFWAHTRNGYQILRDLGFDNVRQLYRPGVLTTPPEYTPLPGTRDVLWYYKADHVAMQGHLDAAVETMLRMKDVNFWLFPDEKAPVEAPNIAALGRIDMSEVVPRMNGMVRYTVPMDIGRSTFEVLAQGRWVIYNWPVPEDEIFCEPNIDEAERLIRKLLEEQNDYEGIRRFQRVKATLELAPLGDAWRFMMEEAVEAAAAAPSAAAPSASVEAQA